jgi:tRNA1(Val) A37 N6-methylase TrmN6
MGNLSLDYIFGTDIKIYQNEKHFKFSLDAVLLANYIKVKSGINILDLGTGNGVIPLILASKNDSVNICGIEIQKDVASLARKSVKYNGLEDRINIVNEDLREIDTMYKMESFDMVVSNPPYFAKNDGQPSQNNNHAFARHELNGCISDFVETATKMIKYRGSAYFVYNSNRLVEFLKLLSKNSLEPKRIKFIHAKKNIKSNIFLVKATKGANEGIIVESNLIVYDKDGYTNELINMVKMGDLE